MGHPTISTWKQFNMAIQNLTDICSAKIHSCLPSLPVKEISSSYLNGTKDKGWFRFDYDVPNFSELEPAFYEEYNKNPLPQGSIYLFRDTEYFIQVIKPVFHKNDSVQSSTCIAFHFLLSSI